jgi:putative CocE/NonD family hydrolase
MRTEAATERARKNTILVLGPWNHTSLNVRKTRFGEVEFGPNAGLDYDEELLRWFMRELRGDPMPAPLPPVSIFVMGENRWRAEQEWPLTRAVNRELRLTASGSVPGRKAEGKLVPPSTVMKGSASTDTYIFDPKEPVWDKSYEKSYPYDHRDHERRPDVMVYTSEPLTADTEVTGEIITRFYVSSTGPDTDFTITLCDVSPDGTSVNLHGLDAGYLRMRYRNGLDHQELMTPGKIYPVKIGGVYTSNLFRKGHRIRLTVSSSIAPHYDPNPNTGREIASETEMRAVRNTIHTGAKYPSAVWLPVIPR